MRKVNVLFVCERNYCRSLTAEIMYRGTPGYDVRSAGIDIHNARNLVTEELINWADYIFLMERLQEQVLRVRFGDLLNDKTVIVLEIPDNYRPMNPDLILEITNKMRPYVARMALKSPGKYYLQR